MRPRSDQYKVVVIREHVVFEMLFFFKAAYQVLRLPHIPTLPHDCVLDHVYHNAREKTFEFFLWSSEFPELGQFEQAPRLPCDDKTIEFVLRPGKLAGELRVDADIPMRVRVPPT